MSNGSFVPSSYGSSSPRKLAMLGLLGHSFETSVNMLDCFTLTLKALLEEDQYTTVTTINTLLHLMSIKINLFKN